jgi:hypothetical protein
MGNPDQGGHTVGKINFTMEDRLTQLEMRVTWLEQHVDPRFVTVKDKHGNVSWEEDNE